MDNIYARQQSLALDVPGSVCLVGAGGVGYWTGYTLALGGVPQIYIFDPDVVSESNLNRLPAKPSEIGVPKASVLANEIFNVRPECSVLAFPIRWRPEVADSLGKPEWLVATTDTHASRKACYEWCKQYGVDYLEAAAEGEFGSVAPSPADFATEDEINPGYASVPVWAGPCMAAGMLAAMHILHNVRPKADVTRIGWQPEGVSFLAR